ncbi:Delta3-Delta2-enoyl-CoA isomerase [Microdochium nivale]|nr:Delta3-Delta2-enoyl-CoA isomerase [Microdochium nivale]
MLQDTPDGISRQRRSGHTIQPHDNNDATTRNPPLYDPLVNIYQLKCRPDVARDIILEGKRWTGPAALEAVIVGSVDGWDGVLELVKARKLVDKSKTGVYRVLKRGMYRGQLALLEGEDERDEMKALAAMMEGERKDVEAARSRAGKVKL